MIMRLFLNDRFILLLILLNAAVIFLQGFDRDDTPLSAPLDGMDNLLTLLFLLEAALKLVHYRPAAYFRDGWNVFDFSLVLLAMPSLAIWALGLDFLGLDFLLVFRVLRVFKFFRVLRFIPDIEHLMRGVARAARSSVLILFAFFVFNFIVSVLSFSFYRHLAPEYFSDPLLTCPMPPM